MRVYHGSEGTADNVRFNNPLWDRHTRHTFFNMEVRKEEGRCGTKVLNTVTIM